MNEEHERLLKEYAHALIVEVSAQDALDAALSAAYISGAIDGKNAEMRKAQEFEATRAFKFKADNATVERKIIEARISLVKAELYSRAVTL